LSEDCLTPGPHDALPQPLSDNSEAAQLGVMLAVFFVLIAVWCVVGYYLGSHHFVGRALDRYGHVIVPFVLIGLGVYIMYESGTFSLMVNCLGLSKA
jgi:cadmium resistance protein CadD (predicted permease)